MIGDVPKSFKTAVVTRATIARGMVTAISWLGVNIRAFAPSDMHAAGTWLGVGATRVEPLMRLLAASRLKLMGQEAPADLPMEQVTQILENRFGASLKTHVG
jgi:hypothetical protein